MCVCVCVWTPFRLFQAAENRPGASTCDKMAAAKDNVSCYQEGGLTVNINIMLINRTERIIPASCCLHCLWRQMASDLMALGVVSLICTGTSLFGGLVSTPPSRPFPKRRWPLAHNHMVNTEQCPRRSSIIYLRHRRRASRRHCMTTEEGFRSQSRRKGRGPGRAISGQVAGSVNGTSWFF